MLCLYCSSRNKGSTYLCSVSRCVALRYVVTRRCVYNGKDNCIFCTNLREKKERPNVQHTTEAEKGKKNNDGTEHTGKHTNNRNKKIFCVTTFVLPFFAIICKSWVFPMSLFHFFLLPLSSFAAAWHSFFSRLGNKNKFDNNFCCYSLCI